MVYDLVSYRIDATILIKPNEKQEKFEEEGFGYYNLSNPGFDRIEITSTRTIQDFIESTYD